MTKSSMTLRNTTIAAIVRHAMKPHDWDLTKFYETETPNNLGSIANDLDFQDNELPVASTILTTTDWTFITTKKIIGKTDDIIDIVDLKDIYQWNFGDFKGYKDKKTTKINIMTSKGLIHNFIIETGKASMVMIYAIQVLTQLTKTNVG